MSLTATYDAELRRWTFHGDTYPHRDVLFKNPGGCWLNNAVRPKSVHYEGPDLPAGIVAILDGYQPPLMDDIKDDKPVEGGLEGEVKHHEGELKGDSKVKSKKKSQQGQGEGKQGEQGQGEGKQGEQGQGEPPKNFNELSQRQGQGEGKQGEQQSEAQQQMDAAEQALKDAIEKAAEAVQNEDKDAFDKAMQDAVQAAKQMMGAAKKQDREQQGQGQKNEDMAKTLEQMRANIQKYSRPGSFGDSAKYAGMHLEMKAAIEEFSKSPAAQEHAKRKKAADQRKHQLSQQAEHARHQEIVEKIELAKLEAKDKSFVPPSWWNDLCTFLLPGNVRPFILIVGPAGNGKTTAADAVLRARYGDDGYVVIDATPSTEEIDLVGTNVLTPDGEMWVDGKVTYAFRNNKAVLINEFDALDPRVAMCLQSALQKTNRYITLTASRTEDRVYPTGDCPIIVTMNTYGSGPNRQYVGRNKLDAATLDRGAFIPTKYENEVEIMTVAGFKKGTAERIVKWATDMRAKIERESLMVILSNRTTLRMAEAMECYGWDFQTTIEKEFFSRMDDMTRSQLK